MYYHYFKDDLSGYKLYCRFVGGRVVFINCSGCFLHHFNRVEWCFPSRQCVRACVRACVHVTSTKCMIMYCEQMAELKNGNFCLTKHFGKISTTVNFQPNRQRP